jgi:hypothetical protein
MIKKRRSALYAKVAGQAILVPEIENFQVMQLAQLIKLPSVQRHRAMVPGGELPNETWKLLPGRESATSRTVPGVLGD